MGSRTAEIHTLGETVLYQFCSDEMTECQEMTRGTERVRSL